MEMKRRTCLITGPSSRPTDRHHGGYEIVHCASENGAERNPQKSRRSEHNTHYCTENRSKSGNVEELDQKYLPRRKDGKRRVGAEDSFYNEAINEVATYENDKANQK